MSFARLDYAIERLDDVIARLDDVIARLDDVIARPDDAIAKSDDAIAMIKQNATNALIKISYNSCIRGTTKSVAICKIRVICVQKIVVFDKKTVSLRSVK
ncbi:MAG: hypothetical protein LBC68_07220 [Prevotellaceae bacterium]|jgi:hypothetical protein|nr:hypothetical protein [Prevotellaceae bacterium]